MIYDLRSDLLDIAPSARPLRVRILLCVVPHHIDSCRPTPFDSVDRSWCLLLPLLQLPLQELLSSSMNPGELVSEELGDILCLRMLLFFELLWELLQPAATEVVIGVVVGVVVVVVIGLLTPPLELLRLPLPLLTTLLPLPTTTVATTTLLLQTLLLPHLSRLPEDDTKEGESGEALEVREEEVNSVEGCGVGSRKASTLTAGRGGGEDMLVEELEELVERDGGEGGERGTREIVVDPVSLIGYGNGGMRGGIRRAPGVAGNETRGRETATRAGERGGTKMLVPSSDAEEVEARGGTRPSTRLRISCETDRWRLHDTRAQPLPQNELNSRPRRLAANRNN